MNILRLKKYLYARTVKAPRNVSEVKRSIIKGETKEKIKSNISYRRIEYPPELFISQSRLSPTMLSTNLLFRIKNVFSKYKRSSIYDSGNLYMKIYTTLHSNERACSLPQKRVLLKASFFKYKRF